MFAGLPGSKQKIGQSFPRGTTMLFWQASAPVGWTKITTENDALLRVVSGIGGPLGGGGSNAFSTVNAQTVVGNTTLCSAQIPSHFHGSPNGSAFLLSYADGHSNGSTVPASYYNVGTSGAANGSNNTTSSGGGSSHNHTITMNIVYVDLILASKD